MSIYKYATHAETNKCVLSSFHYQQDTLKVIWELNLNWFPKSDGPIGMTVDEYIDYYFVEVPSPQGLAPFPW